MSEQAHCNKRASDPVKALQAAIATIDHFVTLETSQEQSTLSLIKQVSLNCLPRFLFPVVRQEKRHELKANKEKILLARDVIKSHAELIDTLKKGDSTQQKLAQSMIETINRYNAIVASPSPRSQSESLYHINKGQLFADEEIKGQKIELPYHVTVHFDTHPHGHPGQRTLQFISSNWSPKGDEEVFLNKHTEHKKNRQFMLDTFRTKGISVIRSHFAEFSFLPDILSLAIKTPITIKEGVDTDSIHMHQILEVSPGAIVNVQGSFNSKFMNMPVIDKNSMRLTSLFTHSGFPYPSQYNAWSLSDVVVNASPLREGQTPLFHQLDKKMKHYSKLLVSDQKQMSDARHRYHLMKDVFDQYANELVPLHRRFHKGLTNYLKCDSDLVDQVLDQFYKEALTSPSCFSYLCSVQEEMMQIYAKAPFSQINHVWLKEVDSKLRTGTLDQRLDIVKDIIQNERLKHSVNSEIKTASTAFQELFGPVMSHAIEPIVLQYWSEKIEFRPSMLDPLSRKLQALAFDQLIAFLDDIEYTKHFKNNRLLKEEMVNRYLRDIAIIESESLEDSISLGHQIVTELELYFNSRYYALNPIKWVGK